MTIPQAGVLPRIHPELLQKKKGSSTSKSSDNSGAKSNSSSASNKGTAKSAATSKQQKAADKVYDIANVDKAAPKSPAPKGQTSTSQAKVNKATKSGNLSSSKRNMQLLYTKIYISKLHKIDWHCNTLFSVFGVRSWHLLLYLKKVL